MQVVRFWVLLECLVTSLVLAAHSTHKPAIRKAVAGAHVELDAGGNSNILAGRRAGRQAGGETSEQAGRQASRQAERQGGRRAGRQAGQEGEKPDRHADCSLRGSCVVMSFYRLGVEDPQRKKQGRSIMKLANNTGLWRWLNSIERLESANVSGTLVLDVDLADIDMESQKQNLVLDRKHKGWWDKVVVMLIGADPPRNVQVVSAGSLLGYEGWPAKEAAHGNKKEEIKCKKFASKRSRSRNPCPSSNQACTEAVTDSTCLHRVLPPNDWRVLVDLAWLHLHPQVQMVLFTDLTDVEVLQNPFPVLASMGPRPLASSEFGAMEPHMWQDRPMVLNSGTKITSPAQFYQGIWPECYTPGPFDGALLESRYRRKTYEDRVFNCGLFGGHRDVVLQLLAATARLEAQSGYAHNEHEKPGYHYCDMIFFQDAVMAEFGGNVLTGWPFHSRYGHWQDDFDKGALIVHKR